MPYVLYNLTHYTVVFCTAWYTWEEGLLDTKWELTVYARCHKKCIVQHPANLRVFLYVWAEKIMPYFQFSFKSWLNNADSELYIYFFKSMLWWLQKVSFQTAWDFHRPWTNLIVQHWAHFRPCLKAPEENILKAVLKVG